MTTAKDRRTFLKATTAAVAAGYLVVAWPRSMHLSTQDGQHELLALGSELLLAGAGWGKAGFAGRMKD